MLNCLLSNGSESVLGDEKVLGIAAVEFLCDTTVTDPFGSPLSRSGWVEVDMTLLPAAPSLLPVLRTTDDVSLRVGFTLIDMVIGTRDPPTP